MGKATILLASLTIIGCNAGVKKAGEDAAPGSDSIVPIDAAPDAPPDSPPPPTCGDGTAAGTATCVIDLSAVVYHASLDVHDWPVTKTISSVELDPVQGVHVSMTPYNPAANADPWPDFIAFPPDGDLRYTVWLFVRMSGVWHGAAVLEFWKDRDWTGAPLLTSYGDWIYPNPGSPWDSMGDYVPHEGDPVGFMTTTGDLRRHKDILTINERSNIVVVPLTATATYTFP